MSCLALLAEFEFRDLRLYAKLAVPAVILLVVAFQWLKRYLSNRSHSPKAQAAVHRGDIAFERGNFPEALKAYSEAIDADDRFALAYFARGRVLQAQGDYAAAREDFDAAIHWEPEELGQWVWRAMVSLNLQKPLDSLRDLEHILKQKPDHAVALAWRGVTRTHLDGNEAALADLNRAIELDPQMSFAYWNRAEILNSQGRSDEALQDAERAVRLSPASSQARRVKAELLFQRRDFDGAVVELNECLRTPTGNGEIYNLRGNCHFSLGMFQGREGAFERSKEDYNRAMQCDPRRAVFVANRAYARYRLGDLKGANEDFATALKVNPNETHAYVGRADLRLSQGEIEAGFADLESALRLDPDNADRHNGVAWRRATLPDPRARNPQAAVKHARKACELTNYQNISFVDTLAAALADAGDFEQAVKVQSQVAAQAGPTAVDYLRRLQLYRAGQPYREALS